MCVELVRALADRDQSVVQRLAERVRRRILRQKEVPTTFTRGRRNRARAAAKTQTRFRNASEGASVSFRYDTSDEDEYVPNSFSRAEDIYNGPIRDDITSQCPTPTSPTVETAGPIVEAAEEFTEVNLGNLTPSMNRRREDRKLSTTASVEMEWDEHPALPRGSPIHSSPLRNPSPSPQLSPRPRSNRSSLPQLSPPHSQNDPDLLRKHAQSRKPTCTEDHFAHDRDDRDHFAPDRDPERGLSVDGLMNMSPLINDVDLVSCAARNLFLAHVKNQASVHDLFFPEQEADWQEEKLKPDWFDWEEFAAVFVCQAICKCRDQYGIHTMLSEQKVDELLEDYYEGPYWKKIGFAMYTMMFPDLVVEKETGIAFRAYMDDDRVFWAGKLVERVRDAQWQYSLVHPVVSGRHGYREYNRDMNIILIKLHLLDPTQVFTAFNYLRKALPDLNMELVTTNYLGEPFPWRSVQPEVERAVGLRMAPSNVKRVTLAEYEVYYGMEVTEFIMQFPRQMGLWSGDYADNKRMSTFRTRCAIM